VLQFKNGHFSQIDAYGLIPQLRDADDDETALRNAGFNQFQTMADRGDFNIQIYRRAGDPENFRAPSEWYLMIIGAVECFPDVYCDSDADWMQLLLQLGPLMNAGATSYLTTSIEMACDSLGRRAGQGHYPLHDVIADVASNHLGLAAERRVWKGGRR
jgi:hypothetical protein